MSNFQEPINWSKNFAFVHKEIKKLTGIARNKASEKETATGCIP